MPRTVPKPPAADVIAPKGHPAPAFRDALDRLRPRMEDVSTATDVALSALHSYHAGTRRPPPAVQRRVAQYLRWQSEELARLATTLTAAVPDEA